MTGDAHLLIADLRLRSDIFTTDLPPRQRIDKDLIAPEMFRIIRWNAERVPARMNTHNKHSVAQTRFGISPSLHIDIQGGDVTNALNACCLIQALAWNRSGLRELNVRRRSEKNVAIHRAIDGGRRGQDRKIETQ